MARDLAEPLASFDDTAAIAQVRAFMRERPLSVVGIRQNGIITGVLKQGELDNRPIPEQARPIAEAGMVAATTPIQEVIRHLNQKSFVLVSTLGQPVGVIMRGDLEKPPMRMWLFGMITLFEMSLTRVVQRQYPADTWRKLISPARVEKAARLQTERARRNQRAELIDCLQLSDKGQIFAKSDELRSRFWNRSRNEIRGAVKEFEGLRNNLAHSQRYAVENWDAVYRLSETLDGLLEIPADYFAVNSLQRYESDGTADG